METRKPYREKNQIYSRLVAIKNCKNVDCNGDKTHHFVKGVGKLQEHKPVISTISISRPHSFFSLSHWENILNHGKIVSNKLLEASVYL